MKIIVSGIPRGYHFPRQDGNWLTAEHRARISALSAAIELLELPAHRVAAAAAAGDLAGTAVALAEGGNRTHYPGELDWEDYQRLFVPSLRWVQLCSTGFSDNVTPAVLNGTVTLTNAPGLHTTAIAESVLAAMLDHAKNLRLRRADQAGRRWRGLHNDELWGRTVLIIGLGRIGARVAGLCKAFGMRVIGTRRQPAPVQGVDLVFDPAQLDRYLPETDYLIIAAPLTPATEGMLGARQFALLKPSAYLINVGRGRVTDEAAMVAALRAGRIAGAYLDAFAEEPLPASSPLWALDRAFVVPHDSHSSPHIGDRMVALFCANLERYLRGETLKHACDPRQGY